MFLYLSACPESSVCSIVRHCNIGVSSLQHCSLPTDKVLKMLPCCLCRLLGSFSCELVCNAVQCVSSFLWKLPMPFFNFLFGLLAGNPDIRKSGYSGIRESRISGIRISGNPDFRKSGYPDLGKSGGSEIRISDNSDFRTCGHPEIHPPQ